MKKLVLTLMGFAALAVLEVRTLTETRVRTVALAVLGLFAVLTWTAHKRKQLQESSEGDRSEARGPEAGGKDVSRLGVKGRE